MSGEAALEAAGDEWPSRSVTPSCTRIMAPGWS